MKAQTETFDIVRYTPPQGWTKEVKANLVQYTITDKAKRTYSIIGIYASKLSSGDAAEDFRNEWNELVVKVRGEVAAPTIMKLVSGDGRAGTGGTSLFKNQGVDNSVVLLSYTVFGRVVSVVVLMNSADFQAQALELVNGMTFSTAAATSPSAPSTGAAVQPSAAGSSFRDISFTAPKGWAQTNYTDAIGLHSPTMECGSNSSYRIAIYNNRPFAGDLKGQARNIWYELYNPREEGEVWVRKWTSVEGWEYLTYETDIARKSAPDSRKAEQRS